MNNVIVAKSPDGNAGVTPFTKICDYSNLESAYAQCIKGKRKFRNDTIQFSLLADVNLVRLWRELRNEIYAVGEYNRFTVYEPKERIVSAPRIRDKIVQVAVHTVLQEFYRPVFISDSYACLEGRGPQRAAYQVQHYMRLCKWKHGSGWVIKLDVKKFFYSIDRELLKQILRKKIKDEKTLRLLDLIIDSSPEGETGLPLGNVTSQDFANIYLNELDQYAKRYLGIKWYVRYMDDVIIVVPTLAQAREILSNMQWFLNEKLHLETNDKTKVFPINQGANAYGCKIWTTHMQVREQSKRAMKRRIKAMDKKLKASEMEMADVQQAVNAWLGHARHSNSYNLAKKIFKEYRYIQVEDKGGRRYGDLLRNSRTGDTAKKRGGTTKANKPVENRQRAL